MKQTMIDFGKSNGFNEKEISDVFDNLVVEAKNLGNNETEQIAYAVRGTKRYVKKTLLTPHEEFEAVVLGDRLTDWAAIAKFKHGDTYPATDKIRGGQTIPDHDFEKVFLLWDGMKVVTLSVRGQNAVDTVLKTGFKYKVKLQKHYKENSYLLSNASHLTEVGAVDNIRKFVVETLKSYIIDNLKSVFSTKQKTILVNGETILELRSFFNDFFIVIDDESISSDVTRKVTVRLPNEKVNFSENSSNTIFLAEVIKQTDNEVTLQGWSAFARKEDIVEAKKIESD